MDSSVLNIPLLAGLTAFTGLCVVVMVLTMPKHPAFAGVLKMLASTAFIAIAVLAGGLESTYGKVVIAGLFFSWWGDLFLIFFHPALFLAGLITFFLGHVSYIAAFLSYGVDPRFAAVAGVLMLVPFAIIFRWLNPKLGEMRIPVYAYMLIISTMVLLSVGAFGDGGVWLMPLGAVIFYGSDIFVARERFVVKDHLNRLIGLPMYYTGQVIFAWTVIYALAQTQ